MSFRQLEGAGQRVPVRLWSRRANAETIRQLQRLASMPYVVHWVAAMPDVHVSAEVAVGSVFATEHTIVPRALGGDLGCGMSAVCLGAPLPERRVLERALVGLTSAIPTGEAVHRSPVRAPDALLAPTLSTHALERARTALLGRHLGTLGGGNHFLELDVDGRGTLWLLTHTGSRGLGAAVAAHHGHETHLDARERAGQAYLTDHEWAIAVARENRRALQERAIEVLRDVLGAGLELGRTFDVQHNFVARERWCGQSLLVHRKGAVAAARGVDVLVPGSMGTASYVARGLGCEASFGSCSHGAGRVLSRGEAHRRVRAETLRRSMHHVVYPAARHLVEEAPSAYRDLDEVMDEQRDLVERRLRLRPVMVLKG